MFDYQHNLCYFITMLNEVNNNKGFEGLTQLKVWVNENLKRDFQITCLKMGSNMTAEVDKLLRQFLEQNLQ